MKEKRCPVCRKIFHPEPYQRICNDCLKTRATVRHFQTHKQFAPFKPYRTDPPTRIRCQVCGTYTSFTRTHFPRYCRNCKSLIYDPKIDTVP